MTTMKPTDEQAAVIEAAKTSARVAVEAYAGCGKTTTLELLARSLGDKQIVYTAFNKAIVESSRRKMPDNVSCRTTHSLAYHTHARRNRLNGRRQLGYQQAQILGVDPLVVPVGDRTRRLAPGWLAAVGMNTLNRWCDSADPEITTSHVAWPRVVAEDATGNWGPAKRILAEVAVDIAQRAWEDVQAHNGRLNWQHGFYLKMFQLDGTVVDGCEMLMLDEAQDTNGVTMAILETHARAGAQLVLVGDKYQEIYAWRGAKNAMDLMKVDARVPLTGSWRFGSALAEIANLILVDTLGAKLPLRGLNASPGTVGPADRPDAYLARTNAAIIERAMLLRSQGIDTQIMGGTADILSFIRAAAKLQAGQRVEHADLGAFDNWEQVLEYVDNDPAGDDLALMVTLVAKYGTEKLLLAFERTDETSKKAQVILSTGHKAKGLEWPTVKLLDDFHGPRDGKIPVKAGEHFTNPEAVRLLYVAATRAQSHLDVASVPYLNLTKEPAAVAS